MNWQQVKDYLEFFTVVAGAYGIAWKALDVYQTKLGKDAVKEFKDAITELKQCCTNNANNIKNIDHRVSETLDIVLSYFRKQ